VFFDLPAVSALISAVYKDEILGSMIPKALFKDVTRLSLANENVAYSIVTYHSQCL